MKKYLLAGAILALLCGPASSQTQVAPQVANGTNPGGGLIYCTVGGGTGSGCPLPIAGSFSASLGGFTPSASGARMTPLTVTTSDSSGGLPSGTVVIVSNAGTTNPMYCNVNAIAATTSDQPILAGSWFAFTIPSGVTTLHCIATGGSTTANGLGGSGLPTGAGGGSSGGGGGGGAVYGPTAVGSAAANPPVLVAGTANATATGNVQVVKVDSSGNAQVGVTSSALPTGASTSALQTTGNTSLGTIATNTTNAGTPTLQSGSTTTVTQATAANLNATVTAASLPLPNGASTSANQATEIASLSTIASNTGASIPAGSAIIGKTGIDQTTPGTTNGVTLVPSTGNGWTISTVTAANSTNATNLKASAGTIGHLSGYSAAAVPTWVTFYNNAGTPTCGTSIVYEVLIPVNSTSGGGLIEDIPAGLNFSTGIAYCMTTGIGGTGSVAASSIVLNVAFK